MNDNMIDWLVKFNSKVKSGPEIYEPIDLLNSEFEDNILEDRYIVMDGVKLDTRSKENSYYKEINENEDRTDYLIFVKVIEHPFPEFGSNLFVKIVYEYTSWDNYFDTAVFSTYIPVTEYKFVDVKLGDSK